MATRNSLWPIRNKRGLYLLIKKTGFKNPKQVNYPWQFLDLTEKALSLIKERTSKDVYISEKAVVEGEVILESGVRIFENAKVKGPCYIGKGTIIGNGSLVRDSIIGENCVVGYCTEIARSLIGGPSWFHTNYVGDSVFEGNVSMGSGAITANLRLDEKDIKSEVSGKNVNTGRNKFGCIVGGGTRFGVNAVPMPGVKIGKNSFIASGVILNQDLPDGSFCYFKPDLIIKKNITSVSMESRKSFHKKI